MLRSIGHRGRIHAPAISARKFGGGVSRTKPYLYVTLDCKALFLPRPKNNPEPSYHFLQENAL